LGDRLQPGSPPKIGSVDPDFTVCKHFENFIPEFTAFSFSATHQALTLIPSIHKPVKKAKAQNKFRNSFWASWSPFKPDQQSSRPINFSGRIAYEPIFCQQLFC
jgi:hypothetical protein